MILSYQSFSEYLTLYEVENKDEMLEKYDEEYFINNNLIVMPYYDRILNEKLAFKVNSLLSYNNLPIIYGSFEKEELEPGEGSYQNLLFLIEVSKRDTNNIVSIISR